VVLVPGMGDLRAGYRFLAPALRAVGYRVACTFVRERSRAPGPPPSAPWLAIDEAGDLATPSLVMAAGELIINARRPATAPSDRDASAPSPVNCGRWRGCRLGSRPSG